MSDTIRNKLQDIPHIRYLNLDERTDRKFYMENQFDKFGIKNYVRISANRYNPSNYDEWKNSLIIEKRNNEIPRLSTLLNQLQSIIDWYHDNISETCLILEDDLNFSLAKYWPFDWNYLVSRLPLNWDCVQFHIIGEHFIPMGLSKRSRNNHGATCYMINRSYAKKLIKMHYVNGKFKFYDNYGYSNRWPIYHYQSADFVPYEIGLTYSFPIFITNSNFVSDSYAGLVNLMAKKSDYVTFKWWEENSKNYSLDDIFNVDSLKRKQLTIPISYNDIETRKALGHTHNGE